MPVQARFYVKSVIHSHDQAGEPERNEAKLEMHAIELRCVSEFDGPSPLDDADRELDQVFGRYTPAGTITMTLHKDAAEQFVVGSKKLVTFADG